MAIVEARRTVRAATAAAVSREQRGDMVEVWVRLLEAMPSPGGTGPGPAGTGPGAGISPGPGGSSPDTGGAGTLIAIFAASRLGQDLSDAFGSKCTIILR